MIKKNKDLIKEFGLLSLVTIVVGIIFMTYMLTIGSSLTDANNLYQEATELNSKGEYSEALEKINHSLDIVNTPESEELKTEIENNINQ